MLKEIIICIIILIIVFTAETVTQSYTDTSIEEICNQLFELREVVLNEKSNEAIQQQTENLESNWEKKQEKLSYYIEHDELEKVQTQLTIINSDVEVEEYNHSIEEIDKCIYILGHIKEKQKTNLKNIF